MKGRTKYFIVSVVAAFLILGAILLNLNGYTLRHANYSEEVNCTSRLNIVLPATGHQFNSNISFSLDGNDGTFVIFGDVHQDGNRNESWHVYRQLKFSYKTKTNGWIDIDKFITTKYLEDNLPDDFFNSYVFDVQRDHPRIRLTRVQGGYLVWNSFTPYMLCTG